MSDRRGITPDVLLLGRIAAIASDIGVLLLQE